MTFKKTFFYILGLFLFSCKTTPVTQGNEILWDTWGIPHIYANNNSDLYKMAGWAQMKNHTDLLLRLYGESRGKSAEYWGTNFEKDKLLHKLGIVENSKLLFPTLSSEEQEMLLAFVDGVNTYANKHLEDIPEELKIVLPIEPTDILAHAARVFYFEFLVNRALKKNKAIVPGSNAWAVSGDKTENGNALLLANPHLPWYDFWLFFECHYITKQNNIYGATLVGLPAIGIGFNQFLGWTHTVNPIDNVDFYTLKVRDHQYFLDENYHDFIRDTIYVKKKENGILQTETIIRKQSLHGIVIAESNDEATAIRFPGIDGHQNIIKQWNEMGKAKSLKEFETALAINTLPLFNILYADQDGNILYHLGGQIPEKRGGWKKWQGLVSGDSGKDIWTEFYDYEELPHTLNPENGWLQNANDPPYTNSLPSNLNPADFPTHISPNRMSFRSQRSASLMNNAPDALTLDAFINLKHDTHAELILRISDDLQRLKEETTDRLILDAIDALLQWDGRFEKESRGAILFTNLISQLGGKNINPVFEKHWSFQDPIQTPDGFADSQEILTALKKAAEKQMTYFKNLTVPYGEVFRIKAGAHEIPANGGFGHLGLFRTVSFKQKEDKKFYAWHGDSFVCAIEFGKEIKAQALLTYGNATQSGNIHIGDQLQLFSEKKLRPIWLERKDQLANLELKEEGLLLLSE